MNSFKHFVFTSNHQNTFENVPISGFKHMSFLPIFSIITIYLKTQFEIDSSKI